MPQKPGPYRAGWTLLLLNSHLTWSIIKQAQIDLAYLTQDQPKVQLPLVELADCPTRSS